MEKTWKELFGMWEEIFGDYAEVYKSQGSFKQQRAYLKDDSYFLEFSAPGYEKEELNISVEGDILILSADIKETDETYWKKSFSSKFRIPKDSDITKIQAKFDKGILVVEVPKITEAKSWKTIKIN